MFCIGPSGHVYTLCDCVTPLLCGPNPRDPARDGAAPDVPVAEICNSCGNWFSVPCVPEAVIPGDVWYYRVRVRGNDLRIMPRYLISAWPERTLIVYAGWL